MCPHYDNTYPQPKHLAISYKPKSYTDVNFVIPPEMCLSETEKLEYILADVPEEIWTNIWEFKLIAEKRDIKHYRYEAEEAYNLIDKRKDEICNGFNRYSSNRSNEEHYYLNYTNMRKVWLNTDAMRLDRMRIRIDREMAHYEDFNIKDVLADYWGDKYNNDGAVSIGLGKNYTRMRVATFIKNVLTRKTDVCDEATKFFNYLMNAIVKEVASHSSFRSGVCDVFNDNYEDVFGGYGAVRVGKCTVKRNEYLETHQRQEFAKLERKEKEMENMFVRKLNEYQKMYFPDRDGGGASQFFEYGETSKIHGKYTIDCPSPHFYKKERSCLAGIEC